MTNMGYRSLDETSRVLIPKEFRGQMGIEPKDKLKLYIENNRIIIEKANVNCRMCGGEESIIEGFEICRPCAERAALLLKLLENED